MTYRSQVAALLVRLYIATGGKGSQWSGALKLLKGGARQLVFILSAAASGLLAPYACDDIGRAAWSLVSGAAP